MLEQLGNLLGEVRDVISLAEKVKTASKISRARNSPLVIFGKLRSRRMHSTGQILQPFKYKPKDSMYQAEFFVPFLPKMEQKRSPRIKELLHF